MVSLWAKGSFPRAEQLDKLCRYFGITQAEMLGEALPTEVITPSARRIPILGTICAGTGIPMTETYNGDIIIDRSIRADYALKVKGDSMQDADIRNGDLVYIRKDYEWEDGAVYAVGIRGEDEAVVRRIFLQDGNYILTPANPKYRPKILDIAEGFIIGRVIGHYREV